MAEVTRADLERHEKNTQKALDRHEQNMKEHINQFIAHTASDVNAMKLTLYGAEGRNGVVGDVTDLKASRRIIKWILGLLLSGGGATGLLSAVGIL